METKNTTEKLKKARAFVRKVGPEYKPPYKDALGGYTLSMEEQVYAYKVLNSMAAERARAK